MKYFVNIWKNFVSLIKGLQVTGKWLFLPSYTVQYPKEKLKLSDRFRGALGFRPETCTSCMLCVRACPSNCISLERKKDQKGKLILDWYKIDFSRCNFCGLCQESCPTNPKSVYHTNEFELIFENPDDFVITWRNDGSQILDATPREQIWSKFLTQ